MNTFLKIIAAAVVLLTGAGCCRDHPSLPQEEIACHRWHYEGQDISCMLRFEDDMLIMDAALQDGEKLSLSGIYYADESRITVDSDVFGTVIFPYRAENEFLYLNYAGKELRLQKTSEISDGDDN